MSSRFVPDAAAVDADWLAGALGRPGEIASIASQSIGTGQVGENVRYTISWDPAVQPGPASVVGKFPSEDPVSRQVGVATRSYEREVGFYREAQSTVDIRTPECFHVDADGDRFVLIMEDIAGASQGDQLAGGSVAQAYLAAEQAAKLHGPRFGSPGLFAHSWIDEPTLQSQADRAALYDALYPGFEARYAARLAPEVFDQGRWLGKHHHERFNAMALPATLIHGDFRLDNMLFGPNNRLVVVDWQTVSAGSGPQDLAYFVGAGLQLADRREHEAAIVASYGEQLRAYVEVADDAIWHDYVVGSASGLFMAVVASQLVGQTERGDEMFAIMAERHAAQMADLGIETVISAI